MSNGNRKKISYQPHTDEVDENVCIADYYLSHILLHINLADSIFRDLKKRGCLG